MKLRITVAATIGFFIPLFWGVTAFILFNAPESFWTTQFWRVVHLTCPFWDLKGVSGMLIMPFLNAALYAGVAGIFMSWRTGPGLGKKDIKDIKEPPG